MTEFQAAYLAGYIDGEGCFSIGCNRMQYYYVQATVASTDLNHLKYITTLCGGALYSHPGKGKQRDYHSVHWRAGELKVLIPCLLPYLHLKKRQAEIVLEFLTRFSRGMEGKRGRSLTNEQYTGRQELYRQIKILNVRGKDGEAAICALVAN